MAIRIYLLGRLLIDRDGTLLKLPARKTEALLAVLARRPGVAHGREWLAALLWPDVAETQARTSLRQAVGHLRRALGETFVTSSAEKIHLDPSRAWLDTAELERGLLRPAKERAPLLDLWRGALLDDFPTIDAPFTDWLSDERVGLTERFAARLEECLAALSAADQVEQALVVGSRLLEIEPTREAVHRAVMLLHVKRGDRVAALRQYERCRDLLRRHVGLAPAPETEALRRSLLHEPAAEFDPPSGLRSVADLWNGRIPLAILPLEPGSSDEQTRLLASGLTEDLTTELSRFRELAVLARGSVLALAGHDHRPEALAGHAGARLVLSGSVRAFSGQVRITAALTDATTGLELWRERWSASLIDPSAVFDRLTKSVVGALALRIDETRLKNARQRPRERLEVYECWLRGLECLRRGTPESDDEARGYFEQALALAPNFARGFAGISLSHFNDWSCQAWDRWEERERLSFENARRAVELDDTDHVTHTILARIYVYRREFEVGQRHLEQALSLNSNDAHMLIHAAIAFSQLGQPTRAMALADEALGLNPQAPDWYYPCAAWTCLAAQRPTEALNLGLKAPDCLVDSRAILAAAAAHLGDRAAARDHARRFVAHFEQKIAHHRHPEPGEPVRWLLRINPFKRSIDTDYLLEGLAGSGLEVPLRVESQ